MKAAHGLFAITGIAFAFGILWYFALRFLPAQYQVLFPTEPWFAFLWPSLLPAVASLVIAAKAPSLRRFSPLIAPAAASVSITGTLFGFALLCTVSSVCK